jgi:hypothetical protein
MYLLEWLRSVTMKNHIDRLRRRLQGGACSRDGPLHIPHSWPLLALDQERHS